jgi:hypothetical protein
MVPLTVPKGTSLQVALEQEVRIKKVGEPIHGRIVEPVYALDRLVVPVGSEITGEVTKIDAISSGKPTLSVLNADFTPLRNFEVGFKELVLPDGRHLSLHTSVTPDSGQLVQFVTAPETKDKKSIKDKAAEKTSEAKQQAKQQWDVAMKQLKTPGRVHRLNDMPSRSCRFMGSTFRPARCTSQSWSIRLTFSEEMTPQAAASLGGPLPEGAVVPPGRSRRYRLLRRRRVRTWKRSSRSLLDGDR